MTLSDEELERYARHIVLREVGGAGQQALKAARVLVIGAGGLGSPVLLYLAAAGIGTVRIVDDDTVSLSNLQRQVAHGTPDVGRRKVDSAADTIARLNPNVRVEAFAERLTRETVARMLDGVAVALDGCDNFETRYLVADACAAARVPLVTAALGRFDGSLTTLKPFETGPEGRARPSYRDLFPAPPPPGAVPACAEAGLIGALPGILGAMMAMEAIKEIAGIGQGLVGRLVLVDALTMRFDEVEYG
jgi:molybdopterin/thiamine biosynthesis adenylyltransferase